MENWQEIKKKDIIVFTYKNWKGEVGSRRAVVKGLFSGESPWHEGEQLFLRGLDLDKMAYRDYAVCDIKNVVVVESVADWDFED